MGRRGPCSTVGCGGSGGVETSNQGTSFLVYNKNVAGEKKGPKDTSTLLWFVWFDTATKKTAGNKWYKLQKLDQLRLGFRPPPTIRSCNTSPKKNRSRKCVKLSPVGFSYEKTPNSVAGWGGGYHHWFSKSRRQSKVNDSISPPKKGL